MSNHDWSGHGGGGGGGGGIATLNTDSTTDQVIAVTAPITITAGPAGTNTIASTAATTSTAGHVTAASQSFSGAKTFLDGVIVTTTKSLLWSADNGAASDIGASGASRPANIRAATAYYVGTNADADCPSIKSATGTADAQKRMIIAAPGVEIRVDVEGATVAYFFHGSGLHGFELKTTLCWNADNTYDVGHYNGSTTAIRPKNVYVGTGVAIGGATTLVTPVVSLEAYGGIAARSSGSATSLIADNQAVTVGNSSHIILSSDSAVAGDRTFTLSNGLVDGQILVLEWSGTNAGEIVAAATLKVSATWTPTQYDTLSLIWSGNATAWLEIGRSTNA